MRLGAEMYALDIPAHSFVASVLFCESGGIQSLAGG